jgi:hypothetical protein
MKQEGIAPRIYLGDIEYWVIENEKNIEERSKQNGLGN